MVTQFNHHLATKVLLSPVGPGPGWGVDKEHGFRARRLELEFWLYHFRLGDQGKSLNLPKAHFSHL